MAVEVFKILNEMCPPVLANLVEKRSSSYHFRYSNILQIPTVHTSDMELTSRLILENVQILINLKVRNYFL